jgi:Zn-dependent protease/CBS domain-containing protein
MANQRIENGRARRWSWRLGSVFGIDLFVHATLLILLLWVAFAHYAQDRTLSSAAGGVAFVIVVFALVVVHEMSHALVARRFGIRTTDITLLPIGGIARLERLPEKPHQELLVALAGPLTNVVIAAALAGVLMLANVPLVESAASPSRAPFLTKLLWVNVSLALFNLLPAFPMDGGRALRALLAMRLDHVRATRIASTLGRGVALLIALTGFSIASPILVLIALFIWIAAGAEAAGVEMSVPLASLPIRAAMITDFRSLSPSDTLATAVERLLAGSQHDFPVIDHDAVVGILTRNDLLGGLARSPAGAATPVAAVMSRDVVTADPSESLQRALERLEAQDTPMLPVLREGAVIGLLTMENIAELLMVQGALPRRGGLP